MLVWVDIESTGLSPRLEAILEVACIITDDNLREVARMECVTNAAQFRSYSNLHKTVQDMHYTNGLWMESLRSNLRVNSSSPVMGPVPLIPDTDTAEARLVEFISGHCPDKDKPPQLAGSTISFDRTFLDDHMPAVTKLLHYRNLDVTSLNELARRVWPEIYAARPRYDGNHRAMADIEGSLGVARYYAEVLGHPLFGVGE